MEILKNNNSDFENLNQWKYKPKYTSVETEYGEMNIHYVDEGSENTNTVLLLHGEPTWGYLYRNFIDPLVEKGLRVVVPDLPGFGKSDKLSKREGYTYEKFVKWMDVWLNEIDLNNITFFGQDWGGLIGLRLVVNNQDRFDNIVLSNTGLPTGDRPLGEAFESWKNYSQTVENFHIGGIVKGGTVSEMSQETIDAYNAPFPDDSYKEAARHFPTLVPVNPDNVAVQDNIDAWEKLKKFDKPTLTLFGSEDKIFLGGEKIMQKLIPGAQNMDHKLINAGHFSQEDQPEELAKGIINLFNG
jgi:haloalkane dehalogenase